MTYEQKLAEMDYGTKDLQTRGALSNTEQNRVFGVAISFIIIIAAAMAIRIYVRFGIIKSVGADDSKTPPQ